MVEDTYPFLAAGDAGVWSRLAQTLQGGAWSSKETFESFVLADVAAARDKCVELEYEQGRHGYAPTGNPDWSWNFWRMNDPAPAFWQEDANPYYAAFNMDRISLPSQWLETGTPPADGSQDVAGLFPHINLVRFDPVGRTVTTEYLDVYPGCRPATPADGSCACDPDVDTCDRIPFYHYTCSGHGCPEIPITAAAALTLSEAAVAWINNDLALNWSGATVLHGTGCIEITDWADSPSQGSNQEGRSTGEGVWKEGPSDPGIWNGDLYVQFPGPDEPVFWKHPGTLTAGLRDPRPSVD